MRWAIGWQCWYCKTQNPPGCMGCPCGTEKTWDGSHYNARRRYIAAERKRLGQ